MLFLTLCGGVTLLGLFGVSKGFFDLRKAATGDSKRADLTAPISWHGTQRHLVVLPGNRLQFSD
jgi:hypothetical protein